MKTVGELLKGKGYQIISIGPNDSVLQAMAKMSQHNVGALLVMDGNQLVGIFSERDYARKFILYGGASNDTKVNQYMTAKVLHVSCDQTLEECMAIMTAHRFRHLPVLEEGGKVVGVISATDLIRESITQKDLAVNQY
jgi:CBS domain-containing protein